MPRIGREDGLGPKRTRQAGPRQLDSVGGSILINVTSQTPESADRITHWEAVYRRNSTDGVSWYQQESTISLDLIDALAVTRDARVVDVGGGASVLVDALLNRGFTDVTVVDISKAALQASRDRVGSHSPVTWVAADLLTWRPSRQYDLWHDRAVFHFLSGAEIDIYKSLVRQSVATGGSVVMATFALDGPEWCSGLPVTRYDAAQLEAILGPDFALVEERREVHQTPNGVDQPFTWIAARRQEH